MLTVNYLRTWDVVIKLLAINCSTFLCWWWIVSRCSLHSHCPSAGLLVVHCWRQSTVFHVHRCMNGRTHCTANLWVKFTRLLSLLLSFSLLSTLSSSPSLTYLLEGEKSYKREHLPPGWFHAKPFSLASSLNLAISMTGFSLPSVTFILPHVLVDRHHWPSHATTFNFIQMGGQ